MTIHERAQVEALKEKLRAAKSPIERIVLYNDPANGSFGVRMTAISEFNAEREVAALFHEGGKT